MNNSMTYKICLSLEGSQNIKGKLGYLFTHEGNPFLHLYSKFIELITDRFVINIKVSVSSMNISSIGW